MRWQFVCAVAALSVILSACAETADAPHESAPPISPLPQPVGGHTPQTTISADSTATDAQVTEVVDGDTIKVDILGAEFTVRYIGIDAPETGGPFTQVECFGAEATQRNEELVSGAFVRLEVDISETDEFGRLLRYVYADDKMVNQVLVHEGYAVAQRYPPDVKHHGLLSGLMDEARISGAGLWSACAGTSTATVPPQNGPSGACEYTEGDQPVIKGNISASGERIFHVPGQENYEITVISEAKGERLFCTEAEAVAAGWRKAIR